MKLLLFAAVAALSLSAQTSINYVATTGNVSLSATATAATLQQPSANSVPVLFPLSANGSASPVGASVYCSVACVATIARSCTTPATATAGTVTPVMRTGQSAFVTFWTASNASGCTTLRVVNVGAGQEYSFDLSSFSLQTGGATSNLNISVAAVTGTVNITFYPVEQH